MAFKFLAQLAHAFQKNKIVPADAPEAPARAAKTTIGLGALLDQRYRLDAEIGRGGMGIVYRAYDLSNQHQVALKVINLNEANALTHQQFLREAHITAQLKHPHIVAVYETGTVDTGGRTPAPFIVMELVQGTSLEEMREFTYARIIDLGQQICDALEYAHSQGFVHRDLKPGNVLIEKHGFRYFVKLADFGLARSRGAANLPTESNLAGTVLYLAPEVIAGQPADISSDLYALGATLYEMMTGRAPFSDFDEQTILAQHLEEVVAPPSHSRHEVPPALEAIVLRLLAKNPQDRFASAQQVRQALDQIPVTREPDAAHSNLPQLPPDCGGGENEIAQVKQLLEANRLVTLLGDGETLALAIGAQLTDQFADGVWRVELESLNDPRLVPQAVATVLGVRPEPHRALTVSLFGYLREKNLLLLLSHGDHFLGACTQLVATILRTCPEVRILAISQQPLSVPAEKVYPVPPLPLTPAATPPSKIP